MLIDNYEHYNSNTILLSHSGFSHLPNGLLQHAPHGTALEHYMETSAGPKCSSADSYVCSLINAFHISSPQIVLATNMFLAAVRWWLFIKPIMALGCVTPFTC